MPIEPDDVSLNKAAIIERCIRRIHQEYKADPELDNYTHQDALILNIERGCQACIDLAMHIIAKEHLGIPQSSGEAFTLLHKAGLIDKKLECSMRSMTGFRNIAVHQYQQMNLDLVREIALNKWRDMVNFCRALGLNIQP